MDDLGEGRAGFRFGDWQIEPHLNRITRAGVGRQLEVRTMEVLAYLVRNHGRTVSADELLKVFAPNEEADESTIHQRVTLLRHALEDDEGHPAYIEAITTRGYRTIADVTECDEGNHADLKELARVTPPFMAYEGDGKFIFACYSHRNRAHVYPELEHLRRNGVNVWYDEGIRPGSEWRADIAHAIENCSRLVYFVTSESVASLHCRRELHYAERKRIPIVAVHLEPTELPGELELQLGPMQALHPYELPTDLYQQKILSVLPISIDSTPSTPVSQSSETRAHSPQESSLQSKGVLEGFVNISIEPFQTLAADSDIDHLAVGLAEDIGYELARSGLVHLVERSANSEVEDHPIDYEIRGSLGFVAHGTHLSIKLIRILDGELLWSENYDGTLEDILRTRPERAKQIARMIEAMINVVAFATVLSTEDAVAKRYFLEARTQVVRQSLGDAQVNPGLIVRSLERALERDPRFLEAHQWLGNTYINRLHFTMFASEALPKASSAINTALGLAPENHRTLLFLGQMQADLELDYTRALESFEASRRAGELPGVIDAQFGRIYLRQGRFEEAVARFDAAFNSGQMVDQVSTQLWKGQALALLGDDVAASKTLDEAIASSSGGGVAPVLLEMAELRARAGNLEQANEFVAKAWDLESRRTPVLFPPVLARLGRTQEARRILADMEAQFGRGEFVRASRVFEGYYFLEDYDQALVWLTRAIEDRQYWLFPRLRSELFHAVREDVRFQEAMLLLERIESPSL